MSVVERQVGSTSPLEGDSIYLMPIGRSIGRNVRFHDARKPSVALRGLTQNWPVTVTDFLDLVLDPTPHGDFSTRSRKDFRSCDSEN